MTHCVDGGQMAHKPAANGRASNAAGHLPIVRTMSHGRTSCPGRTYVTQPDITSHGRTFRHNWSYGRVSRQKPPAAMSPSRTLRHAAGHLAPDRTYVTRPDISPQTGPTSHSRTVRHAAGHFVTTGRTAGHFVKRLDYVTQPDISRTYVTQPDSTSRGRTFRHDWSYGRASRQTAGLRHTAGHLAPDRTYVTQPDSTLRGRSRTSRPIEENRGR